MWRLSKSAIPCSLATMVNGHVNPKLMRSIRIWQWRWQSSKENVLEKTGRMLQKRMESWKRKKNPARFQHKNPCKLQANMLKPLDFPRENSMIFEMKINSFAMAKTTFFSKTLKTLARFSPRRVVYATQINIKYCYIWRFPNAWGYPNISLDGLCGKSKNKTFDLGYPYFRKPPDYF